LLPFLYFLIFELIVPLLIVEIELEH